MDEVYRERLSTAYNRKTPVHSNLSWSEIQDRLVHCNKCEQFNGKGCKKIGCTLDDFVRILFKRERSCPLNFFGD